MRGYTVDNERLHSWQWKAKLDLFSAQNITFHSLRVVFSHTFCQKLDILLFLRGFNVLHLRLFAKQINQDLLIKYTEH